MQNQKHYKQIPKVTPFRNTQPVLNSSALPAHIESDPETSNIHVTYRIHASNIRSYETTNFGDDVKIDILNDPVTNIRDVELFKFCLIHHFE